MVNTWTLLESAARGTTLLSFADKLRAGDRLVQEKRIIERRALDRADAAGVLDGFFRQAGVGGIGDFRVGAVEPRIIKNRDFEIARAASENSMRYLRSPLTVGMPPPKTGSARFLARGTRRSFSLTGLMTSSASAGNWPSNLARTTSPLPRSRLVSPGVTVTPLECSAAAHRPLTPERLRTQSRKNEQKSRSATQCAPRTREAAAPSVVAHGERRWCSSASRMTRCWR